MCTLFRSFVRAEELDISPLMNEIVFYVLRSSYLQLLPLPTSYPVSPNEGENADLNKFNKRVSENFCHPLSCYFAIATSQS